MKRTSFLLTTAFSIFFLMPFAYSASIKEILPRYSFTAAASEVNITNHSDFMIDKNSNGVNDTLVFELAANSASGTYFFIISLFDKNAVLTNETNITLSGGKNRLNITFSSILLSQNRFNYSIKVYNSSYSLKYRKDGILTGDYTNYEEGFNVVGVKDSKINKTLTINLTLNSSLNGTFETALFLAYNKSIISIRENKPITGTLQDLIFTLDSEAIKRTHYAGTFNISLVKIGRKVLRTNFTTSFYDFRDFAESSYFFNFSGRGIDTDNNSAYDFLEINASAKIARNGTYTVKLALHDLFGSIVEIKNASFRLNSGKNILPVYINGSGIYGKKLNGPFVVKYAELFEGSALADRINDAYTTGNYNFNDFGNANLPDLRVNISVSGDHHYGVSSININFTFTNAGNRPAFNFFADIFDNATFSKAGKSGRLDANSQVKYQLNFSNFSDFEVSAIADSRDFVEELNESNNAEKIVIKLNRHPKLEPVGNMTLTETDKIAINLSANDPNGDNLSYLINFSGFSKKHNIFQWNTTTTDSGTYTLMAVATDGFLNDSRTFKITILDAPEKDIDNDGINDSVDSLIGNRNSVNTSTLNITLSLGGSNNLSRLVNEAARVKFMDSNLTIAEFDFNFSLYKLNLTSVTIDKQPANSTGFILIKGLKMHDGATKAAYIDRVNTTLNGICVKDEEISAIGEISSSCSLGNEHKIECDGTLQGSYACTYNSTLSKYRVQGLRHSGIIQIDYFKLPQESGESGLSSPGGGSSGSSATGDCVPDWVCSDWSQCINNFKNRKCFDAGNCNSTIKKPQELQQCESGEKMLAGIISPFGHANKTTKRINQTAQTNKLANKFTDITGQVVMHPSNREFNYGIFLILIEVALIVGAYLALKMAFSSKIFK